MNEPFDVALLVIDVQQGLFEKKTPVYNADQLLRNICLLIDRARQNNVPVIFMQHANENTLLHGSDPWRLHPDIQALENDPIIEKRHGSAFKETLLQHELDERQIRHLIVTGLVTHGCIRATCFDALRLGYKVTLVKDGHSNYHKQAKRIIGEWNQRFSQMAIQLKSAQDIDFL